MVGGGLLALLLLAGCGPAGAMAAAQAAAGLLGTGSEPAIRPGTAIQNGHYRDESIGQALATARSEPLAVCRARLPEGQSPEPGQCGLALICLPGAVSPTELYVCAPPPDPASSPAAQSGLTGGSAPQNGIAPL